VIFYNFNIHFEATSPELFTEKRLSAGNRFINELTLSVPLYVLLKIFLFRKRKIVDCLHREASIPMNIITIG